MATRWACDNAPALTNCCFPPQRRWNAANHGASSKTQFPNPKESPSFNIQTARVRSQFDGFEIWGLIGAWFLGFEFSQSQSALKIGLVMQPPDALGIIAGSGVYPLLLADAARV